MLGQAQQLFIAMVLLYEFCRLQTYILDSERQDLIIYHVGDAFRESIGCQYTNKQCALRGTRHPRYNKRSLNVIKGRGIMDGHYAVDHDNAKRFLDVRPSG